MDYLDEKNQKSLLKEFALRFPNEVKEILKYHYLQKKNTNSYIGFSIKLDTPPDYSIDLLSRKEFNKFIKLKLPYHYRKILVSFMEFDLMGKMPKIYLTLNYKN